MSVRNIIVIVAIFSLISFAMGFWTGVLVEGHNLKTWFNERLDRYEAEHLKNDENEEANHGN